MARKKKPEEHEEHTDHEKWMVAYADILTLLLALFIVMFAMAAVDKEKVELFAQGAGQAVGVIPIPGQLGNFEGGDGILNNQRPSERSVDTPPGTAEAQESIIANEAMERERARAAAASAEKRNLEEVKVKIEADLEAQGMAEAVRLTLDSRGLVVDILTDDVLFDIGRSELREEGAVVIDAIAPTLLDLPNFVSVEGHTDDVPITGTYRSNWPLSGDRASRVTERLIADGLRADRVAASGFADTRPLESNDTPEGRSANRRVSIVVLPYLPVAEAESGLAAAEGGRPITPDVAPTMSPPRP
ncbi:MAG: flagellar motor protein MotB [Mobilicoccus sp.]|nr:flagellar motor protein MotB [Mobilicoccus sp.]